MAIITRLMKFHFAVLLLTGCVNIPPESITVNERVSAGVVTMEENTNLVINAWRETAVALLEEQFDAIYDAAEEKYRGKKNISSGQALNDGQVRDVAVLVMLASFPMRQCALAALFYRFTRPWLDERFIALAGIPC